MNLAALPASADNDTRMLRDRDGVLAVERFSGAFRRCIRQRQSRTILVTLHLGSRAGAGCGPNAQEPT